MDTSYHPTHNSATSYRLVFFGTPSFAVPTLEALHEAGYDLAAVVTQPDKPVGRGLKMEAPAVKVRAQELGLYVLQPTTLKVAAGFQPAQNNERKLKLAATIIDNLQSLNPDLGIAVAYGKIIPKEIIDLFPRGILNIHPSLLPKYRGPSPIQAAILNGDTKTGMTIMLLDEEMDHGPVLARNTYHVTRNTRGGALSTELAQLGTKLLIETLPKWLAGEIAPDPQDHAQATFTKLLAREDGKIDWQKPAEYVERLVRAYDLWPGTWTTYGSKRLKILAVTLLHSTIGCATDSRPGFIWKTEDDRLAVNCSPGSLVLEKVQLEGKRAVSGLEFLRGHPKILHTILS